MVTMAFAVKQLCAVLAMTCPLCSAEFARVLEMVAFIVGQCDGDRIFVLAHKLVVVAATLMGEGFSCAPHRDAFAVARNIDRLG
jgi:hypothetical protein